MTMDTPHLLENVHFALSDTFESASEIYITRGKFCNRAIQFFAILKIITNDFLNLFLH